MFKVKNILEEAEPNLKEREQIYQKGGVIQIEINWNRNFDQSRPCLPIYSFNRFDLSFEQASSASGFNFRFSHKFEINGTKYRYLVKAYGIRFIISVTGKAGKFNFVSLLLNIGAGVGLLSVATIAADFILLNFTNKKDFYRDIKKLDYKKTNVKKISIEDLELTN